MPDHIRLLEHEYDDLRRLLSLLPTTTVTRDIETDDGDEVEVDVEEFVADNMGRGPLAELTLRIGEIYDNARARAIREHLDVAQRIVASAIPEVRP